MMNKEIEREALEMTELETVVGGSWTYIVSTGNGGKLNMRKGPSKKFRGGTRRIPNNTLITVLDFVENGEWAHVSFNGQTGYVMTEFIKAC